MPKLEIVLAHPEVRSVSRTDTTWLLTGCDDRAARKLEKFSGASEDLEAQICTEFGDATIVKIHHGDAKAHALDLWRGPTSTHEVFRLERDDGGLVIADHFRNALAEVPKSQRTISEDAIVDHFMFRTAPGHSTYCRPVRRLGHGEHVSIQLAAETSKDRLFHRLDHHPNPRKLSAYLDDVDQAFDAVLSPLKGRAGVATLFSGGVDSTLLHSYLGPETVALNLVVDSEDATSAMEVEYAKRAAEWLGITMRRQDVPQSDFLREFELSTENAAMPMHLGMLAVFARAFSNDYDGYISGWSADALFGHSARFNRIASLLANPLLIWCLDLTARAVAQKDRSRRNIWRARMELLLPAARQLAEEPESLRGLGARAETYAEFDLAEKIFGAEAISRRLEARLDYVTERVALSAPSEGNFIRHLEIFAWIDLFCRDFMTQLRHLGIASEKAVHLPFIAGPVVRSAQGIPAGERYIKGMEGKYILKRLLKRRVPSYPIGQRKGSTALVSFPSHYKTGPLSRIWDRYDVPDLIPDELRNQVVSSPLDITYNALTYAVWKRRVLESESLTPLPAGQRHEWVF